MAATAAVGTAKGHRWPAWGSSKGSCTTVRCRPGLLPMDKPATVAAGSTGAGLNIRASSATSAFASAKMA